MEKENHINLTPAESYFIQDPKRKEGRNLMKYTLLHLIYKKILASSTKKEQEGVIFKKEVDVTYITRGEKFSSQRLKPHEKVFISAMNTDLEIKLKELIEKVFEKYNFNQYRKLIESQLLQDGFMDRKTETFLIFDYKKIKINESGLSSQKKINSILKTSEDNLENWVKNNPPKAKAFLESCGPNLFILGGFAPSLLQSWNQDLKKINKSSDSTFLSWGDGSGGNLNEVENIGSFVVDLDGMNSFDSMDSFDSFDLGFEGVGDSGGGCGAGGCGGGGCGGGGCGGGGGG